MSASRTAALAAPRIAVMGAGAVGCYYGAMLARAGCDVTLIGRAAHVQVMQTQGLRLQRADGDARVPVRASTTADAVRGARWVLLCVKSTDTLAAADAMAPHLDREAVVLSLQNGVENAERLRARLPQTVVPVVVYVATQMAGPGHVQHHGRGELVMARWSGQQAFTEVCAAAGIPVQVSDAVDGALWSKLVLNCAYNAMSAIGRITYGPLWDFEGVPALMRTVTDECLAVAHARGVRFDGGPEAVWAAVERIAQTMPTQYSSTAQDYFRAKPSEIDHLNGAVVRLGEAAGIATPANRAIWTLMRLAEAAGITGTR